MRCAGLAALALLLALAAPAALGQPRDKTALDDAGFIEMLRREDPALAERFIALRDAQTAAAADLQQAMRRYGAGGPELRAVSLPQLQQARRRYGEASLAMLDFLDARDRAVITRLEGELERVKRVIEERARQRPELERFRRGE
jgi:hypothetical protein